MNLPDNEIKVYNALERLGGWQINPAISNVCGIMHNYCSKLLSFLIKKGLVESRRVVKGGKTMNYSEYRIKSVCVRTSNDAPNPTKHTPKVFFGRLRQVKEPCPQCGSYYRVISTGECNVCVKKS